MNNMGLTALKMTELTIYLFASYFSKNGTNSWQYLKASYSIADLKQIGWVLLWVRSSLKNGTIKSSKTFYHQKIKSPENKLFVSGRQSIEEKWALKLRISLFLSNKLSFLESKNYKYVIRNKIVQTHSWYYHIINLF